MNTTQINIKVEKDLKNNVNNILNKLGLSTTEAVRIFFKKIQEEKGIPFDLKLNYEPNETTIKAIKSNKYKKVKNIKDIWK